MQETDRFLLEVKRKVDLSTRQPNSPFAHLSLKERDSAQRLMNVEDRHEVTQLRAVFLPGDRSPRSVSDLRIFRANMHFLI